MPKGACRGGAAGSASGLGAGPGAALALEEDGPFDGGAVGEEGGGDDVQGAGEVGGTFVAKDFDLR